MENPFMITVDRKDITQGYIQSNVVFCTHAINSAKGVLNENDFFNMIEKTHKVMVERQNQFSSNPVKTFP